MGYESKLYIVEKNKPFFDGDKPYAEVISMFDMCVCPCLSDVLRDKPNTDCYFYADDDDTKILEDRYGKPLTETTADVVIGLLESAVADGEDYRRIFPLLSALKTIDEQQKGGRWNNIVVLHYGY